jgi:hypothetical protein
MLRSSVNWIVMSERARRRHRVDAGDRAELPLERRGHRRGHCLRRRPREIRNDLDGRKIDVRQVVDRQLLVGHHAEDQDGRHQQRGEDGTADEQLGVHDALTTPWPA